MAVLVSLVIIAVAATSFVIASNLSRSCIGGPLGTCPPLRIDPQTSIEISGLKMIYSWKQPVEFAVIAHKFSGCTTINVTIFDEYESQPPLYQTSLITDCNAGTRIQPNDYVFPIVVNSLNATNQGTYKVHVSYYQNRANFGEIEQSFKVTKLPVLEETLYSNSTEFTVTLDAGSKGLFTVSGSIDGAQLSDISYNEYLNQIQVSFAESENGRLRLTVPQGMLALGGDKFMIMVMVDMEESEYDERIYYSNRILEISFPQNTKEIWIIGTFLLN
jgi:hypothetical protein